MLAITASRLITPHDEVHNAIVRIENGRILSVASREAQPAGQERIVDFGDGVLAPAYIDLHIHGSAGHDVMSEDAAALPAIEQFLAQRGVASYFPTTVTAPIDDTLRGLERLADAIEKREEITKRARPLGIHLEGPFLSHVRRGVHPPEQLQKPSLALFDRMWQAARGHIRVLTVAPEIDGAGEVIAEAARRGVLVALGHSDADFETAQNALRRGGRHATHTFNAMRPLGHRDPGLLGAVLTERSCSADIIADGIHVDPAIVKLFLAAKGRDNSVLITDATAATGMPDGHYRLGSLEIDVRDGRCTADGKLAGSVLTMDRAVRNIMKFAEWDLAASVQAASANPARVVGLKERGVLEPGRVADFVVLDNAGNVRQAIVGGNLV